MKIVLMDPYRVAKSKDKNLIDILVIKGIYIFFIKGQKRTISSGKHLEGGNMPHD